MGVEAIQSLIEAVAERIKRAEVFEDVRCEPGALRCQARDVESEALYQLLVESGDKVWIGLHTPDRWLSESIEADLLHLGDKMEDLLEEELVELDYDGGKPVIEHFRDDAKMYVFRSPLAVTGSPTDPASIDRAVKLMLGYEACFRQLGDMSASDELV
jgi:hypothetical protein